MRGPVLAGMAVFAALVPATAVAGTPDPPVNLGTSKGVSYVKRSHPNVLTQTAVAADCPVGTQATGGGASMSGKGGGTAINTSYPFRVDVPPVGWAVEGSAPATNGRTLTAFVACAVTGATVAEATEEPPAGNGADHNVPCGIADYLSTGGGMSASNNGVRLAATYPRQPQPTPVGTWQGAALNQAPDERVVTFYAVCSRTFLINYRSSDGVRVEPGEGAKASVSCKPSEAVLGGGIAMLFQGTPYNTTRVNATRPRDSKADGNKVPDDGWFARGRNESTETLRLRAFAACKAGIAPE